MEHNEERKNLILLIVVLLVLGTIGTIIWITSSYSSNETTQDKKIEIEKSDELESTQAGENNSIFNWYATNEETEHKTGGLILIDIYYDSYVGDIYCFYDSDTYVMYYSIEKTGLVQRVNPDGTPKIYKP